ncbi:MAG TPA: ABC transporter permease [Lactovum miscens]|uniref:ABC transporter permease n=1 Tax=Lactovum miscens TaxID=190387 RepID=UPI002ED9E3CF
MNFFSRRNQILLKELIKTDFKLRYQGSVIGYLWSILKPLMLFVILYLVFVRFMRFGAATPHFAVSLLLGITLWNFFGETTNMGMTAIVGRGDLLRKINFSKPVIIASITVNALINLLITLIVVIIFALVNGVQFSWTVIFAVPLLAELVILAFGIALILSTIYVRFRDIGPIWEVLMQAAFYGTPIIYPITQISVNHLTLAKFQMLNPVAQILQDMRFILTYSNNTNPTFWQLLHQPNGVMTNPWLLPIPYSLPFIILGIGLWVFTKNSKKFAEIL